MEITKNNIMGRKAYTSELLVERGIFPDDWEERLYEVAKKGKGKMYYASELGLHRDTLYSLIDRDPKFKKVIKKCMELAEQWWVDKVIDSFENENSQRLNTNLWIYMVQNQFRDSGWVDRKDITTDGKPINTDNNIQVEIIKPKDDEDLVDKE